MRNIKRRYRRWKQRREMAKNITRFVVGLQSATDAMNGFSQAIRKHFAKHRRKTREPQITYDPSKWTGRPN